ncbi:trehalose-phosphatase [Lysobacter sp. H23M47]|uniref:trehalose-phosphatase n=1 Tax=Lysobacter sp. H23M47 TaxID=2781024 RepID=UPI00187ED3EA|nr:trehalose-phosphatase [Lysobacter sp. H23M47]QOW24424.1 trehalose-phosphatase [Lysobacter sp. H23M47]
MNRERPTAPPIQKDWALFLDADGTLLPIASTPGEVTCPPGLLPLLGALAGELGGALAIVSGRPLSQLRGLFPEIPCCLVGHHGRESDRWPMPDLPDLDFTGLLDRAREVAVEFPGILIEDKQIAVALHWRRNPTAEAALTALAHEYVQQLDGYMLQAGRMVIEVRPTGGKGDALRRLMAHPPWRGRRPVFVGDDLADESGFAEAAKSGGLGVLVGKRTESVASRHLKDVAAVHEWLARGLHGMQSASSRGQLLPVGQPGGSSNDGPLSRGAR